LLLNNASGGRSWREHGVNRSQVEKRNEKTSEGSRELWDYCRTILDKHVEMGNLKPGLEE
jgi:putative hydrolase of HD superfamily